LTVVVARLVTTALSLPLTFAAEHVARADDVKWVDAKWTEGQPHEAKEIGISGMALADDDGDVSHFVVVHDGKKNGWARLSVLAVAKDHSIKQFKEITVDNWPDEKRPDDFEAVAALPEGGGPSVHFLALTSDGMAYMLAIDAKHARGIVEWKAELPGRQINPPDPLQFEAFAFAPAIDVGAGRVACAWAQRGQDAVPASLHCGVLDLASHKITEVGGGQNVSVAFPKNFVRHISDVRVDAAGKVLVSAASDPGDDGPFASAVYSIGTLEAGGQAPKFKKSPEPQELTRSSEKKTEAIELTKNGLVLGSDDENNGAAIGFTERTHNP
jgi:hypothetical protein